MTCAARGMPYASSAARAPHGSLRPSAQPGQREHVAHEVRSVVAVQPVSRCAAAARPRAGRGAAVRRTASAASPCRRAPPPTVPMHVAPAPSGWRRRIASARAVVGRGDEGHHPSLAGDVERIEAEELAGARDRLAHRHGGLVDLDRHARIERRSRSGPWRARRASGRAGSGRSTPPSSSAATRPASGAQSLSTGVSNARPSRTDRTAMPWRPTSPERSTASPATHPARAHVDALGDEPDAGRVDEQPVALAAVDHLRVTGDQRHAALVGGGAHRGDDAASSSSGRPSSRTKPALR